MCPSAARFRSSVDPDSTLTTTYIYGDIEENGNENRRGLTGFVGALDRLNTVHRSLRFIPGPATTGTAVTGVALLMR